VKLYGSDYDIYDIINDYLEDNQIEKAFYLIDLGENTNERSITKKGISLEIVKKKSFVFLV
jgi:hypothetical protein